MSEYGEQPALDLVNRHPLPLRTIAWLLGVEPGDLHAVLRGEISPTTKMPERLAMVVGVPPEGLFTAEALAATAHERRVAV